MIYEERKKIMCTQYTHKFYIVTFYTVKFPKKMTEISFINFLSYTRMY